MTFPTHAAPVVAFRSMSSLLRRRDLLQLAGAAVATAGLPGCAGAVSPADRTIRVGILHSRSGAMAPSEGPVALATRMAIAEWNGEFPGSEADLVGKNSTGISLEAIPGDGASDPETFAKEARRLIADEGVAALFGCWTSSSRRAVIPVVESLGNFLVYPLQYEGLESSGNVLYTGATPNQQLLPGVRWAMERFGPRVYMVGSDYVFPRVANAVIRDQLGAAGVEAAGEAYLPLDAPAEGLRAQASAIVGDLLRSKPDVIVSTLNGMPGNVAFFRELRAAVPATAVPSISFSIGEPEARAMSPLGAPMSGDYAGWTWLPDAGDATVGRFWESFGRWAEGAGVPGAELPAGLTDPMVSAIAGVRLWAAAYAESVAGSGAPTPIPQTLAGRSAPVPGGRILVDSENLHVWKPLVVGQFGGDGLLQPVYRTELAERPRPYPAFRSRASWERILAAASSA